MFLMSEVAVYFERSVKVDFPCRVPLRDIDFYRSLEIVHFGWQVAVLVPHSPGVCLVIREWGKPLNPVL